jgi:hypothetical protein
MWLAKGKDIGWESLRLWGPTSHHWMLWMVDKETEDLMFALLDFILALDWYFLSTLFLLLEWECLYTTHCILEVLYFVFHFTGLVAQCCLKSQRNLWTWTFEQCWKWTEFIVHCEIDVRLLEVSSRMLSTKEICVDVKLTKGGLLMVNHDCPLY